MATWDDVDALALGLPGTSAGIRFGERVWRVGANGFAWVRPLRQRDRDELGDAAPGGEILGLSTADLDDKRALIDEDAELFFTTTHFDGYAAILVALDRIPRDRLEEIVIEAWLARAPKRLARDYLAGRILRPGGDRGEWRDARLL